MVQCVYISYRIVLSGETRNVASQTCRRTRVSVIIAPLYQQVCHTMKYSRHFVRTFVTEVTDVDP